MKILGIDVSKCNHCQIYQVICKDKSVANNFVRYTKHQPDTGVFWVKVDDEAGGSVPIVKIAYLYQFCRDCAETPCIKACKQKAIYKSKNRRILIDPLKCIKQKNCTSACPHGVIYITDDSNLAQKPKWCDRALEKGWKEPCCIDACPTVTFTLVEEEAMKNPINPTVILNDHTKAVTFYIGKPTSKKSIKGISCELRSETVRTQS